MAAATRIGRAREIRWTRDMRRTLDSERSPSPVGGGGGRASEDAYRYRFRWPATISATPASTAAAPAIGGIGTVFSVSAVAWMGPISITVSRLVYVKPW